MKWLNAILRFLAFLWPRRKEPRGASKDTLWEARKGADRALDKKHRRRDVHRNHIR